MTLDSTAPVNAQGYKKEEHDEMWVRTVGDGVSKVKGHKLGFVVCERKDGDSCRCCCSIYQREQEVKSGKRAMMEREEAQRMRRRLASSLERRMDGLALRILLHLDVRSVV